MRIVFPYLAQTHQIPHSFPVAAAMSARPGFEVHIACSTPEQDRLARKLAALYPQARLQFHRLRVNPLGKALHRLLGKALPPKKQTLKANLGFLSTFDAAVVPERTSLVLRRWLPEQRLVFIQHGPPGRAVNFARDIADFDFVVVGGETRVQRLLAEGLLHPGRYHASGYPKFDLVQRLEGQLPPLFPEARPTVLYNPHFEPELSSWPGLGLAVLDHFAQSRDYNLVFAPHIRLFDQHAGRLPAELRRYQGLPHIHLDIGSERSIDMSYVSAADLYLGDVSSQVAEFLWRPRPCVFLNAHRVDWRDSPDYLFWHLGPVTDSAAGLRDALTTARERHADWLPAQQAYFRDCFGVEPGEDGRRQAARDVAGVVEAIAHHLQGPRP